MVGELIGEGAAQEQTVVGETPNLAARLQALAEPGTCRDQPGDAPAGRRAVRARRPRPAARSRASPSRSRPGGSKARVAPRAASRRCTASVSRRWSGASTSSASCSSAGRGPRTATARWCCSSGEPGIGKSRLVRALRERLGDEPYTPLSHYCSPYHTNSALHPVIDLLERAARLERDEPPEASWPSSRRCSAARATGWTRSCRCSPPCSGCRPASAIRR